eukprot:m.524941 g.524941  ORF g.524941 m.524941 type:complete len:1545 (+) comp21996_c0_seq3:371-5005(+)
MAQASANGAPGGSGASDSFWAYDPRTPMRDADASREYYGLAPSPDVPHDIADKLDIDTPAKGPITLKKQEMEVTELRKENFNLKLRIYHMEEQMRQIVPGDATHAVQRSIELSVALEAAQKEIADKNALILKAQQSIDDIAHNYEDKLRTAQDAAKRAQLETRDIQSKYVELEQRLTEALQEKDRESTRGDELVARVAELESRLRTYTGAEDARDRADQRVRAAEAECSRLRAELEEKEKALEAGNQDKILIRTQQETINEWQSRARALEERLTLNAAACDAELLRAKDDTIDNLRKRLAAVGSSASGGHDTVSDNALISSLRQEISELRTNAAAASATSVHTDRRDNDSDAAALLRAKEATIVELNGKVQVLDDRVASLQRALTAATDGRTRDDGKARVAEAAHAHEISTLETLLTDCRAQLREKQVSLQRVQAELDAANMRRSGDTATAELRSSLSAKETLISDLREQVRVLSQRSSHAPAPAPTDAAGVAAVDEQRRRMDQLESMVASLSTTQRDSDAAAALRDVQAQLTERTRALETAEQATHDARATVENKDHVIRELTDKLTVLQNERAQRILHESTNPPAPRGQQQHEQLIAYLQNELDSREHRLEALSAETYAARTSTEALLEQAETRAAVAEARVASLLERNADVEAQLARLGREVRAQDTRLRRQAVHTTDWEGTEEVTTRTTDSLERVRVQLADAEAEIARLGGRLRAEEARADEAMTHMHAHDAAIRKVQRVADDAAVSYAAALRDVQHSRDALQQRLDDVLAENDRLHAANTGLGADVDVLDRRVREQEAYIVSAREENDSLAAQTHAHRRMHEELQDARDTERKLGDALVDAQTAVDRLERELQRVTTEVVELRTQNNGLRGELDVVRGVAAETEENDAIVIRDLTGKLNRLRDDLAHAEENVSRLKNGFVEKETRIRQLERVNGKGKDLVEDQERALAQLTSELRDAEDELHRRELAIGDLEGLVSERNSRLAAMDDLAKALSEMEGYTSTLTSEKEYLTAQVRDLEHRNGKLEREAEEHEVSYKKLKESHDDLGKTHGQIHNKHADLLDKHSDLTDVLKEREDVIRQLTKSLQEATEKLASAQLRMTVTPEDLAKLRSDLEAANARAAEVPPLRDELATRERNISALEDTRDRLARELTDRCTGYTQTIDTLEDELVQLRGLAREKDDLEAEAANLANACEGLSVQLDQTRTLLADMEHAKLVAEGKLADLVAEVDALHRERRALASELDHQTVSRGELLGKHKTLEARLTEVERLLSSAEADRTMLDEQVKSAMADLDATQRRLAATEGDRDSLKVRVESLQQSLNTEAAERKTACDKIATMEARLHECEAALDDTKARADEARARAEQAEHERDRMELQHQSAVNEFKLASAANEQYCTERSDHERRIGDLLRELDRITAEFHRTERRLADCELENGALREDNEVLAARLDAAGRERAALADKLNAHAEGIARDLSNENMMLRTSLAETTALAERLREQLILVNGEREEGQQELQSTLRLLRRTKEALREEERHCRIQGAVGAGNF